MERTAYIGNKEIKIDLDYINAKLFDAFAVCEKLGVPFTDEHFSYVKRKALKELKNRGI